jgi:hypothetical protein
VEVVEMRNVIRWLLPSRRMLRVSAYLTCVSVLLSLVCARLLHAHAREGMLGFGEQLSELADLTRDAEAIVANGQRFHVAKLTLDEPLAGVLDRVERYCAEHPGVLGRTLASAPEHATAALTEDPADPRKRAIVREEAENKGVVVCFTETGSTLKSELWEALGGVARGDFSSFGRVVYTFAERSAEGTRVTTVWSAGGLDLSRLFPAEGDAAGTDSSLLPRPPAARRTLSASADGAALAVRVYQSTQALNTVRDDYARAIQRAGFLPTGERAEDSTAYLNQHGQLAIVSISEIEGRTYVTLTEGGQPNTAAAVEAAE